MVGVRIYKQDWDVMRKMPDEASLVAFDLWRHSKKVGVSTGLKMFNKQSKMSQYLDSVWSFLQIGTGSPSA
jgi:hypothetical protein